jgi:hypothetical protein
MRSIFILVSFYVLLVGLPFVGAQSVLYWDMQQPVPAGAHASLVVSSLVQGNNVGSTSFYTTLSPSQQYAGASGAANAGLAARTGALSTGVSGSGYIGVTLTPTSGYRIRILSVAFGSRSTASGPARWSLFSSVDQFANTLFSAVLLTNSTWSWQQTSALSITSISPVELRIYGYEGVGAAAINVANWRLDDLTIQYQLEAISLPVTWIFVRYAIKEDSVQLHWATAAEINNKEFQVERSVDGHNFTTLSLVYPGSGPTGTQVRYYSIIDALLSQPSIFYRIKQVDKDGSYSYSPTVLVRNNLVMPSPFVSRVWFDRTSAVVAISVSDATGSMAFHLYNSTGQLVRKKEQHAFPLPERASFTLNVGALPKGIYYLVVYSATQRSRGYPVYIH